MINIDSIPPMLSDKEFETLIEKWNEDSWKILAERNMRLALKVMHTFSSEKIEDEELFSVLMIALVKSAKKFDPNLGNRFSTYAVPAMKNEALLYMRHLKIHPYPKKSLNETRKNLNGDDVEIGEFVDSGFDMEQYAFMSDLSRYAKREYEKMCKRDRDIISGYMNGYNQQSISKRVGCSQASVSRTINIFRKKIRMYMEDVL